MDLFAHELTCDELKTLKNQLASAGVGVGLFIPFFLAEMGVNFPTLIKIPGMDI